VRDFCEHIRDTTSTKFLNIYCEVSNWIKLANEDMKWRGFVETAMNRRVL
jgi:hypothetical protein